uniref:phage tail tape measure protein n=1 Tax=Marinobacterium profundum TaxID=1714300 RepID=UPI00083637DF|nr:phage tail tape measure protein [Marinobacterium profundum]
MAEKNKDIIELVIEGTDEYSDVSEAVRAEMSALAEKTKATRSEFDKLEQSLDLADTYRAQEQEVSRLAQAQAEAKLEVDRLTKANKEARGANVDLVAQLAKAKAEFGSLRTATNKVQKAFDGTKDSMRRYGVDLKTVEANQDSYRQTAERLAVELTDLSVVQTRLVQSAQAEADAVRESTVAKAKQAEEEQRLIGQKKAQLVADQALEEQQRRTAEQSLQYSRTLHALTEELRSGNISWEDYKRRVTEAGRATELSRTQVAKINQALDDRAVAARKAAEASARQAEEERRVERATREYRQELEKLANSYRQGKVSAEAFEVGEQKLRNRLKLSEAQVKATRRELNAYTEGVMVLAPVQDKATASTGRLVKAAKQLAVAYGALQAAQASARQVVESGKAYATTENAMLGLGKTTNLTASELQGLADTMEHLSSNVTPTTKEELLKVAEAAGRMGVQGADNIRAFTKSIDALSSATGIAGDDAAQSIAQILNVTGEAQKNVVGVSAAIAELGNNTATTEEQIIHFAKRLASDTATVKLTSAEVLGLSGAFAEMGQQAEGTSTVVGRTFRYIEDAVKGGGKPLEDLIRLTGKTHEELQKAFGEDKVALFGDFLEGLNSLQDGGQTLNSILDQLGIKSDENARILGLLSQRYEGVTTNVDLANTAFEKGTAHFAEMAKKAASLESGFDRLQNRAKALQEKIGEAFSDDLSRAMNSTLEDSEDLDEAFAELGEGLADVAELVVDFVGTLDNVLSIFGALTGDVGLLDVALAAVSLAFDGISVVINTVTKAIAELGYVWNKFTGDTEDMERWKKVWNDASDSVEKSVKRQRDSIERLSGDASRAYQDLRDTYNENREALDDLDEEQRQAAETILKSTGYLEGNDKVYRQLTRAIQRAAREKQIYTEYTTDENEEIKSSVALMKAQGIEEEEAIRRAKEKIAAKREEAAATEEGQQKQKVATEAGTQAINAQADAWKILKLDVAEVTNSVTEQGGKSAEAFQKIAESGKYSAETIKAAFGAALDNAKTAADVELLIETLNKAGLAGVASAEELQKALERVGAATTDTVNNVVQAQSKAWKALGLDINEVTDGITDQGREAADAFLLLASEGEYSAKQISQAFDSALSKTRTKADIEALIVALEKARKQGVLTGDSFKVAFDAASDKIKGVKRDTKDATDEVDDFNDTLKETGKVGKGAIGELTTAIRSLIEEVQKLQQGYEKAAESAQKMTDAANGDGGGGGRSDSGGSGRSTIKRGKLGAAQRQELLETGDRLAVEIYDELIAGLAQKLEGKVLSPYDDTVVSEPKRLAELARKQAAASKAPPSGFGRQTTSPAQQSVSQVVRMEFVRGGRTYGFDTDNETTIAFLDTLAEVGAITR